MSAPVEEQLRDYFVEVDTQQVPVDVLAIVEPPEIGLDQAPPVVPFAARRRRWLLISAAAAVLVIALLVTVALATDDDSRTITDTPSTTTTTAPTTTTTALSEALRQSDEQLIRSINGSRYEGPGSGWWSDCPPDDFAYAELTGPHEILAVEVMRLDEIAPLPSGSASDPGQLPRVYQVRFRVPAQLLGSSLPFDHTYHVQIALLDDELLARDDASRRLGYRCMTLGGLASSSSNAVTQTFPASTDDEANIVSFTNTPELRCPPSLQYLRVLPFTDKVVAIEAGPLPAGIVLVGADPREADLEDPLAAGRWYRAQFTALAVPLPNFEESQTAPVVPVERTWESHIVFFDDGNPGSGSPDFGGDFRCYPA